jgi:hypothetical protein
VLEATPEHGGSSPSPQATSSTATTPQAAAVDASHGVEQEDKESPQGDELKATLGE